MPTFWDLLPASAWPVQPFIPPFDSTQPSASPPLASPSWDAANSAAPADTSLSDALADAERAHAFALWMFGPPGTSRAPPMRVAAADGAASQRTGDGGGNAANPVGNTLPGSDDADQSSALSPAVGNPNLARQGARARAAAATRPPPPPVVADILPEVYQAGADALRDMNAGLNPFSDEARAAHAQAGQPGTPGDALAAAWENQKRVGRGLLGIPKLLAAPITGTSRSVVGHGLQWIDGRMRDLAVATLGEDRVRQAEQARGANPGGMTYDQAKQDADSLMWGLGPRGGLRPPARPPASSPMGSRGLELDRAPFQPNRNLPGTVNRVLYSGHAFDQMQNRGLPPSVAEQAMREGAPSPGKTIERVKYYDPVNGVVVVRDKYTGNVISVMRTRQRDRGGGDDDDAQ
jgi:hypothetical protein